jgi:hypothetical protein
LIEFYTPLANSLHTPYVKPTGIQGPETPQKIELARFEKKQDAEPGRQDNTSP